MASRAKGGVPARASPGLDRAVRHLLRPLVRLLVERGVRYPELADILKDIYFQVAMESLAEEGEATTSRISLGTGLHRKDVKRMREADPGEGVGRRTTLASEVFTRWVSDRRFLDERKRPRPLPRLASVGGTRSFEALAESVSRDVRPKALLDELTRLGLVEVDGEDRVVLDRKAFVPKPDSEEMHFYFGENVHDHLAASVHNLLGLDPMMLEQAIFGGDLSRESVDEIARLVRASWDGIMRDIVPKATELDARDARDGKTDHRMRFGLYFYAEPKKTAASKPKAAAPGGAAKARARKPSTGRRPRGS